MSRDTLRIFTSLVFVAAQSCYVTLQCPVTSPIAQQPWEVTGHFTVGWWPHFLNGKCLAQSRFQILRRCKNKLKNVFSKWGDKLKKNIVKNIEKICAFKNYLILRKKLNPEQTHIYALSILRKSGSSPNFTSKSSGCLKNFYKEVFLVRKPLSADSTTW